MSDSILNDHGVKTIWRKMKELVQKKDSTIISDIKSQSSLSVRAVCPTNYVLYDDLDNPSIYVYIPKFRLCDVLSIDDKRVHPAFLVNGKAINGFYVGKFQGRIYNDRMCSLPGEIVSTDLTLDMSVDYNRSKGGKFHEITAAEWAAIALWCHKNGSEPKGNNDYGKDVSETLYKAVPGTTGQGGAGGYITTVTETVATGTGPITWTHDGTLEGVWDMNGNVMEWCTGLRLVHGELQVIPLNNAADPMRDLSSDSAAWKAIDAATTSTAWDDLFITPDGNGTTPGSVKLDWDGVKWVYSTVIAHEVRSGPCTFASVTADASIGAMAKLFLQAIAMLPDTDLTGDGIATDYNRDYFAVNNYASERLLIRGGRWDDGVGAGVFDSYLNYGRLDFGYNIGGRSASID